MNVRCVYCLEWAEPSFAYQRIQGWERKASADSRRGGSDISLREHVDEFACFACVERKKAGVNIHQGTLA